MNLPPYGITSHCKYVECRDGDTVVVSVAWWPDPIAVRLMDCWTHETDDKRPAIRKLGHEAKLFAMEVLENETAISLHIPGTVFHKGLVKALTFDRIPGHIYVGTEKTLSEMMCCAGKAYKNKLEQQTAEKRIEES